MTAERIKSLAASGIKGIVLLSSSSITHANADAVNDTVNAVFPTPLRFKMIHVENINLTDDPSCISAVYRALKQMGYPDPAKLAGSLLQESLSVQGYSIRGRLFAVRK